VLDLKIEDPFNVAMWVFPYFTFATISYDEMG
jgi:hypothetical protein